jgi:hypothetical protein
VIPDQRLERPALLLTYVYVTALVRAGDRVAIIGPTPAVPLLRSCSAWRCGDSVEGRMRVTISNRRLCRGARSMTVRKLGTPPLP